MYEVGQAEIDAVSRVIRDRALFRYGVGQECGRFEARYAAHLGVKHFALDAPVDAQKFDLKQGARPAPGGLPYRLVAPRWRRQAGLA
jgi:dTDP-4-amino-4,6-dideoxygalactose transaminase